MDLHRSHTPQTNNTSDKTQLGKDQQLIHGRIQTNTLETQQCACSYCNLPNAKIKHRRHLLKRSRIEESRNRTWRQLVMVNPSSGINPTSPEYHWYCKISALPPKHQSMEDITTTIDSLKTQINHEIGIKPDTLKTRSATEIKNLFAAPEQNARKAANRRIRDILESSVTISTKPENHKA